MDNKTPNAVFYGRVSTDRQDTRGEQQAEVRRFCEATDGLELDPRQAFYEEGVTGEYFAHGAYREMLNYLRSNPDIRYIVVRDTSRFGRPGHTRAEAERHRLKAEFGVIVLSALEPFLNIPLGEPEHDRWGNPKRDPMETGRLVTQTATDQALLEYRLLLGDKSREGVLAAYHAGRAHGGPTPLFFVAIPTGERDAAGKEIHRMEPDPATKHLHQAMFEQLLVGASLPELARWLEERGIVSPGKRLRTGEVQGRPGRRISASTLRYRLKDWKFIGCMVYNRYWPKGQDNPSGRRERPRDFWRVIEEYCTPTVDAEVFFKVQDMLVGGKDGRIRHTALLTGTLKCGSCGSKMTVVHSKRYSTYRCSGRKSKKTSCTAPEVGVRKLDRLVEDLLFDTFLSGPYLESFISFHLPNELRKKPAGWSLTRQRMLDRKAELEEEMARARLLPDIPEDMRREYIERRDDVLRALGRRIKTGEDLPDVHVLIADSGGIGELPQKLRAWWRNATLKRKRAFLRAAFSDMEFVRGSVGHPGQLKVMTRFPDLGSVRVLPDKGQSPPGGNADTASPAQARGPGTVHAPSVRMRREWDSNPRCD